MAKGESITSEYLYELSQLDSKKVGGISAASPLQQIDYKYNIRGWMTKINDPSALNGKLFGYELRYTNPINTTYGPGRHNGNIAEVDWRTAKDNELKRYSYSYDALNRLNFGHYSEPNTTVPLENHYGETTEYDLNGNIMRLYRNAKNTSNGLAMQIDDLTYVYSGNKLTKVTDASQNYLGYAGGGNTIGYDLNGNMTSHIDKNLKSISYNHLNLPNSFKSNSTGISGNSTSYLYRADGTKLRKAYNYTKRGEFGETSEAQTITDYLDGFQYTLEGYGLICVECPVPVPDLQFVPTSEGYFDFVKNKYIYNYTDHLGNVRLSYMKGRSGIEIIEENNYYPFGLKHGTDNPNVGNRAYQYKYNGKELQETGMYDYGARFYMPDIGRWGVVDPKAETSRRWSTYTYAYNNPIRFIDPDGMENKDWIRKDGKWQYDANVTTVEQAQKMAGVDGFAKNGTVLADAKIGSDGEAGYVRLSEGGKASYEPTYGAINALESAMPMSLGGTWTTWTAEEFPQITYNGGMARTDFDASTHDKKFGNDKTFNLDWGSFVAPSTFPNPSKGGSAYALSWAVDRLTDAFNLNKGNDETVNVPIPDRDSANKGRIYMKDSLIKYDKNWNQSYKTVTDSAISRYLKASKN